MKKRKIIVTSIILISFYLFLVLTNYFQHQEIVLFDERILRNLVVLIITMFILSAMSAKNGNNQDKKK